MDFDKSETRINLMRAFAGESQARNRYTFAAQEAKKQKQNLIYEVFSFTAGQEKEHAEIFYGYLSAAESGNVEISAGYPVDADSALPALLSAAHRNEYEEYEGIYPAFAQKAEEEGFPSIQKSFDMIAKIEKSHGDRFAHLCTLLEKGELYTASAPKKWLCLNCGHIAGGVSAPQVCPVCAHPVGYFAPMDLAPYTAFSGI